MQIRQTKIDTETETELDPVPFRNRPAMNPNLTEAGRHEICSRAHGRLMRTFMRDPRLPRPPSLPDDLAKPTNAYISIHPTIEKFY
ncbi:unnamed protein product [Tilletia controversa]|uniref:Uncharacterized protein n=1 Tax=Tilletia caries TaxID=13290 RepID=A0A8T8TCH8_9BASI|nr:hypothetical protein CF335_g5834 [Tilletia laevis]KAE8258796.1 hypothetical protein A4X03_0g4278 [Tilletia caries]CAD6919307.1 unnamed protein product [Tilletia controversa]KAE8197008.1 hypothetical protein CF336_g2362 [Tilletia laevis]CAD6967315.1 unnamed protein product [Tilletia controversa]